MSSTEPIQLQNLETPAVARLAIGTTLIGENESRSKARVMTLMGALYLVLFVAALDQTIIATAVPTISSSLNSATGYTWIGSAYVLAQAASGPIWAQFSDIWGRKVVILAALGLFAGSNAMAGASTSMAMLISARALQGVGSGGMSQLVSIIISDLFSVRQRAAYLSWIGAVWIVAGAAGPLIGGALTQTVNWRWCFWINLCLSAVAWLMLLVFLDLHNPHTKLWHGVTAIDWSGTLLILAVTLLILLGLDFGGVLFAWSSTKVICMLVFGFMAIPIFVFCERRAKFPIMPLGVFGSISNIAIFTIATMQSMVASGVEFYLPFYFQSVQEASPLRSGIYVLPLFITASVVNILAGVLMHRTGRYREIMWVGVSLMATGTGLFIDFGLHTTLAKVIIYQVIAMAGIALLFQPPLIAIQNTVKQANTASATATLGFLRDTATAASFVIGGVVFQNSMDGWRDDLVSAGLGSPLLEQLSGGHAAANTDVVHTISDLTQRQIVKAAFAWSIRNIFITYTSFAAIAVLVAAFIKHSTLETEHTECKTGI